MSVPHLDTRVINGESSLLFGPFAGFTMRFLKHGSMLDLIKSVRPGNLGPHDVSRYSQLGSDLLSHTRSQTAPRRPDDKSQDLFPEARDDDWKLIQCRQRVQIIK